MIIDIDDYMVRQSRRSLADRERVAEYYGSAPLFHDQRPGEPPVRWLGKVYVQIKHEAKPTHKGGHHAPTRKSD